jgi:hypothetical protein
MTDHQGITNREKPKSQIAGKRTSNPRFPANPITSSSPNYQAFSSVRGFFTGDQISARFERPLMARSCGTTRAQPRPHSKEERACRAFGRTAAPDPIPDP